MRIVILAITALLLSGCASVFESYPSRMQPVRTSLSQTKLKTAINAVEKHDSSINKQLNGLELGRLQQLAGLYKSSQASYATVIANVRANQLKAKLQMSRILANTGSLIVNARMIPYRLDGYEVVFLYSYQALNYLAQGNFSAALVSIRRGQAEQQWIKQQNAKEIAAADKKAKEKGWKFRYQDHAKYFKATTTAAKYIKSGFENAFFYYLSAVLYQANGDYNNALVSIKSALALNPDNPVIHNMLLDILALRGGNQGLISNYLSKFGIHSVPTIPKHSGLVVVLFEQGLVPRIQAVKIPISISRPRLMQMMAFPVYQEPIRQARKLKLTLAGNKAKTQPIMDVYAVVAKALLDKYPEIFIRNILSLVAKTAMAAGADKKGNHLGLALAQAYNVFTAAADQRSWLTLPLYEQAWQQFIPAGQQKLTLYFNGHKRNLNLRVRSGQTTLVWAVAAGRDLMVKIIPVIKGA